MSVQSANTWYQSTVERWDCPVLLSHAVSKLSLHQSTKYKTSKLRASLEKKQKALRSSSIRMVGSVSGKESTLPSLLFQSLLWSCAPITLSLDEALNCCNLIAWGGLPFVFTGGNNFVQSTRLTLASLATLTVDWQTLTLSYSRLTIPTVDRGSLLYTGNPYCRLMILTVDWQPLQ